MTTVLDALLLTDAVRLRVEMNFLRYYKTVALETPRRALLMYGPPACGEHLVAAYIAQLLQRRLYPDGQVRLFVGSSDDTRFGAAHAHATDQDALAVVFIPRANQSQIRQRLLQCAAEYSRVVLVMHTTAPVGLAHTGLHTMFLDIPPDEVRLQCLATVVEEPSVARWICDLTGPSTAIDAIAFLTTHLKRRRCRTRSGLTEVGYPILQVLQFVCTTDTVLFPHLLSLLRDTPPICLRDYAGHVDYFRHTPKYCTAVSATRRQRHVQRILDESSPV
jgi:hypothetical protein